MELQEAVLRVQMAYPRIYLACHSRHQNSRTTANHLSQRDATLLAHLSEKEPTPQSELARHMGVAKSTLSEALSGLEEHGYIARQAAAILRTRAGSKAMSTGSVLEAARLEQVLRALTADEQARAIDGLELLARAARQSFLKETTHANEENGSGSI
jgi:DNA-binding MarR family transcriptional regulator